MVVVEDLGPVRSRFSEVISAHPELQLLGAHATLKAAKDHLRCHVPDVLLVDIGLPDGSGIELIREIQERNLPTLALVISIYGDEQTVIPALEAGAAGYLLKDHPPEQIPEAIFQMMAGGAPISPAIARHMLKRFRPTETEAEELLEHLTPREREVLEMVGRGYTSSEIAELSGKSYHTVTTHVRNIYRKLAVNSRAEAVSKAMRFGLLDGARE
ncbi:response regulator [Shimia sp. MIT1388]|uniref:response regulator n=1 Tax=Shimia sp. MIT1388 TaxID=3096992 RepID=UPI00399B7B66